MMRYSLAQKRSWPPNGLITSLNNLGTGSIWADIEKAQATVLEWCLASNDPECQELQDTLEEVEGKLCPFQ
jgi:hypothetical protein